MGRDASWKERLVGERGHGSHYLDARVLSKEFPLSFILIETPIHPDVYYIHIYAQRTPTQREKWVYCSPVSLQGHTWFQNHAEKKYIHRNGTKVASAHLRLIFVCVSLSLSVSFSLSFSRSLPSPLSLHISSLPSPLHTLSLLLHSMVGRWEVLLESSAFCSIWAASKGGWL